jgi:hypothetical protein
MVEKSVAENRLDLNGPFDSYCPRECPLAISKSGCWIYTEEGTGNKLHIDDTDFFETRALSTFRHNSLPLMLSKTDYKKSSNGNYFQIRKSISPFSIMNNGAYYFFDGTKILVDVERNAHGYRISLPRVKRGYRHPFVYDDGRICFDGDERWKRKGVQFNTQPSLSVDLAHWINIAFNEAHFNLVKGYSSSANPVKDLNPNNFAHERKRGELFVRS